MRYTASHLLCTLLLAAVPLPCVAQRSPVALSEGEVEEIREASLEPARRIILYQQITDLRVKRIQDALANTRGQGRTQDIHEAMEQITGLVNEIEDNLSDYGKGHRDLRKALPKLSDAIIRWESVLKQPPENDEYALTRRLALEAVDDLREESKEMLAEQKQYFKDHPPPKETIADRDRENGR